MAILAHYPLDRLAQFFHGIGFDDQRFKAITAKIVQHRRARIAGRDDQPGLRIQIQQNPRRRHRPHPARHGQIEDRRVDRRVRRQFPLVQLDRLLTVAGTKCCSSGK